MIAEQQDVDLRGDIMILPTDNPDDRNILTYKLETDWPDLLLTFLSREKLMHTMPLHTDRWNNHSGVAQRAIFTTRKPLNSQMV